jgi:hypothetical protein
MLNKQQANGSNNSDAFPALPAAAKPTSTIFSPGYTGAGLRRDHSGRDTPINNAWGSGANSGSSAAAPAAADDGSGGGGKKKGNKNKKQTLFHFG